MRTYATPGLGRMCDTTLEVKAFMGPDLSIPCRNHNLVNPVAVDADQLLKALSKRTFVEAARAGMEISGFGEFVWKNISIVVATSLQVCFDVLPWAREFLSPDVEEAFVAAGTNGIATIE